MLFRGLDNNMEKNILEQYRLHLNKIYENSQDSHNIYTPLELCEEMINSLSDLNDDKSILVISNLEFLIVLKSKISLDNVHYTTSCEIKKQVSISLGVNSNNVHKLEYNNKEINLGIENTMKFDYVIQNPPYSNSTGYNFFYKNFVELGIELLKENGYLLVIHPDSWRNSNKLTKFANNLKLHLVELHQLGYSAFDVGTSVDWYLYSNIKTNNTKVVYINNNTDVLNLNQNQILSFSKKSIPSTILSKITKENYNNKIIRPKSFFNPPQHNYVGKYKQCGGRENKEQKLNATSWINDVFSYTEEPSEHQFENKIVMSYIRKPRARYFNDNTGVLLAYYWLEKDLNCNPNSLVYLLNSDLFWKIHLELINNDKSEKYIRPWYLQSLNIENCYFTNDDEMYEHFNLTQEEINWIEQ